MLLLVTISATFLPWVLPLISGEVSLKKPPRMFKQQSDKSPIPHQDPPLSDGQPQEWASSGLGVILFVLSAGFHGGFYILAISTGCSGPIGGCGTISCTAGTYLPEVYVFMQLNLTLIPVLYVREVWQALKHDEPFCTTQRWLARILIYGMVVVTLTGVFPARYATDIHTATSSNSVNRYQMYGILHTAGISIGCIIPVFCSFAFFMYNYLILVPKGGGFYSPIGVCARIVHIIAIVGAFALYLSNGQDPNTLDYCSEQLDRDSCNSWMRDGQLCPLDETPQVDFMCGWEEFIYTDSQKKMLPPSALAQRGKCIRSECKLYANSFSIAAEYAALYLPLTYLISFALADIKYLHDDGNVFQRFPEP